MRHDVRFRCRMAVAARTLGAAVFLQAVMVEPAHAHHSFAMFDQQKCLTVSGTVMRYQWAYPHIWLWISVDSADQPQLTWAFEGADPGTLAVYGWHAGLLKKGSRVTVTFNPLHDGRHGGSMRELIMPNGDKLGAQGGEQDETFFKACTPSPGQ